MQLASIKKTDNNSSQSHNSSSTCLTDTQVRVLSKDLRFTSTPRRNTIEMEKDIHNFTRKLRLTEYFANENDITFGEETQPLVKNKGTFYPPRNRNKTLDIVPEYLKIQNLDGMYRILVKKKICFPYRKFLNLERAQVLAEAYISSSVRYCSLIWFSSKISDYLIVTHIEEHLSLYMIKNDHMKNY